MVEEFISSPTCRMSSGFTVRDEVTDIDAEIRKKKLSTSLWPWLQIMKLEKRMNVS